MENPLVTQGASVGETVQAEHRTLTAIGRPDQEFDYKVFGEAAEAVEVAASTIRSHIARSVRGVGDQLLIVKRLLPHGAFGKWVLDDLGMQPRTAQNYMRTASFLEGKCETIAHLPPAILYQLAAPAADADVVGDVVGAAAAGMPLTKADIEHRLDIAAQEKRELAHLARRFKKASPEQLKAKRAAEKAQHQKHRQEVDENKQKNDALLAGLSPLAQRLAAKSGSDAGDLLEVLRNPELRWGFQDLLIAALKSRVSQ